MIVYLISVETLKEVTSIHGNLDEDLINPSIKSAQDLDIHPLLGTALFNKIMTDAGAGTISGHYKTLLDTYLTDTLAWYTMAQLPTETSYQFWNKGVLRKGGDNTESPSLTELITIADRYKRKAEAYAERTRKYLKENASSHFPEYINPGNTADTICPDGNPYECSIFLD